MNDKWLNDIQKRMSAYSIPEPEGLWENLDEQLPARPHRNHAWAWTGGLIAFAVLAAVLVLTHNTKTQLNSSFNSPVLAEAPNSAGLQENTPPQEVKNFFAEKPEPVAEKLELLSENIERDEEESVSEIVQVESPERAPSELPSLEEYLAQLPEDEKSNSRKALSINAFTAGATGSSHTTFSRTGGIPSSAETANWNDSPLLGIMIFNQGKEIKKQTRHNLPLRFGLTFSYAFNDRLQLSSGAVYTLLTSSSFEGSESSYVEGNQTLNYVGIPLSLNYTLFTSGHLNVYASAGIMAEKCVGGKISEDFVVNGGLKVPRVGEITAKPWQFSVNLSVGIAYQIARYISIYAEPGLAYYFNDGSVLNTIYKEKPLNFDLRLGLRLHF